jgi:hypothetical protein
MKKAIFAVVLFLIPFCVISQTRKPIEGFSGIKFGSNAETIKTAFISNGAHFSADSSNAEFLAFMNVTVGSRKDVFVIVKLIDDRAYEADFVLYIDPETKIIEAYNNTIKEINESYGQGQSTKNFTLPYNDGDGKEIEAIKSEKAEYFTVWEDKNNNTSIETKIVKIDPALLVSISYQNAELEDIAIKRNAAKN